MPSRDHRVYTNRSLVSRHLEDEMRALNASARWLTVLTSVTMLACSIDIADPGPVELQVIEEIEFASSLGIDLAAMEMLGTGVYIQDLTVGEGAPLVWGDQPRVRFAGWLNDGTGFDSGEFGFLMGNNQVVPGFEQGIFGMRLGGVRRIIIPPILAYGAQGGGSVPPGAVLIFEVEVLEVVRLDPS